MNEKRSFWRKVIYVGAIAALLIPMSWLSMPASRTEGKAQSGGKLAKLRQDYKLGQASLGEIDPASETMKLATLGMRGLAVTILWEQANYYKKTENWTNFQASLKQIARLQPNFISVWQYQAWNTSYNLSVEFDDYNDRYKWVIRGIDFLKDGLRYNKDEPRLLWDLGWFISQKIGRADEHVQYRRLFKRDPDFHAGSDLSLEKRDNWLVGKFWFQEAIDAVDKRGKRMKGKPPLIYRSDPGMSQINYADAIQTEGVHGELAGNAWKTASEDWKKYGDESILTTWDFRIQLNDLEHKKRDAEKYLKQMNELSKGMLDKIRAERLAEFTPEQRELSQKLIQDVPTEQVEEFHELQARLNITPVNVAHRIEKDSPEQAIEASRLGKLWYDADRRVDAIERYRQTINFNYWQARCAFEQMPETLEARELVYKAGLAHEKQDLLLARKLYEQAWPLWRKAFDAYPLVANEGLIAEEVVEKVANYRTVLEDLSVKEFPQDFILRDVVEGFDREGLVKDVFVEPAEKAGEKQPGDSKETSEATAPGGNQPDTPEGKETPAGEKVNPPEGKSPESSPSAEGTPPEPVDENAAAPAKEAVTPDEKAAPTKESSEAVPPEPDSAESAPK
jgi:hypothetical protein